MIVTYAVMHELKHLILARLHMSQISNLLYVCSKAIQSSCSSERNKSACEPTLKITLKIVLLGHLYIVASKWLIAQIIFIMCVFKHNYKQR